MLAIVTYLMEDNSKLRITNVLLAPIVLISAKSKLFLSMPMSIILFIISTLSTNKLIMTNFNITPINIPK